jgi:hypothetical protein
MYAENFLGIELREVTKMKRYTVYSESNDMTFIMEESIENGKTKLSVVGFYFGEPSEASTNEYVNNLTAEFE